MVGHPLATLYMSVIDAYYFFECVFSVLSIRLYSVEPELTTSSTFSARSWLLDQKVEYMQDRVAYMIGFGMSFLTY